MPSGLHSKADSLDTVDISKVPEAEVIGAFGHGVESLLTTARGNLRAILECNRHLYAAARQMSEIVS
ncbi:MAG TPA: hypothetical protein VGI23_24160, partial [Steroidobacteraceae bacterium]